MMFYKKKKSSVTKNDAYASCLRKLNYRDYSYAELQAYLQEQEELDGEFIDQLLDELKEQGYINDTRFAQSIYNDWLDNSLKGKYQLINKLHKYQIDEGIINNYLTMDTTDLEIIRATVLLKKYIKVRDLNIYEHRAKILNYLKNQYYMPNIIFRAMDNINEK